MGQVVQQILRVLDADAEADELIADAERFAFFGRDVGIAHQGQRADERLDAAEAGADGWDSQGVDEAVGGLAVAVDFEGDDAAESAHGRGGDRVVLVAFEAGIPDLAHGGLGFQEAGDGQAAGVVLLPCARRAS